MPPLDERTSLKIDFLAEEGNVLLEDDNDPRAAIMKWHEALGLLPSPAETYSEALWLHASIGEACLELNDIPNAQISFEAAYKCPDGHVNPLVLLRLGEIFLRQSDEDAANKFLLQAYMLEGDDIFQDSPEAFAFLKTRQPL